MVNDKNIKPVNTDEEFKVLRRDIARGVCRKLSDENVIRRDDLRFCNAKVQKELKDTIVFFE